MELKFNNDFKRSIVEWCFNRTFMELKFML